ncbi:MAG: helix-turn-helix transcriptional regulator [Eubacteriales bacterium]|nr:helix-turn-helix transcriptional regulator [Eubacteriales bacterium]MDD4476358.1 helix-turn-helix transcriptional regulator [Eubacteriales bacterium]
MTDNKQKLAENRLKVVLAEQKKTCRWLASQIGKSENTVSRWCANRIQPSMEQLYDIAQILNVDVRSLLKPIDE